MKLRSAACAIVSSLTLSSFGPAASANQAPTPSESGSHQIALAPVGLPERPVVVTIKTANDYFGVFGIAAALKKQLAASKELSGQLSAGGLDYRIYVPGRLEAVLKDANFEVSTIPGDRKGGDNFRFLTRLSTAADADILDVFVSYLGYWAPDSHTPYHPLVQLSARLSRSNSNSVRLETKVNCGKFAQDDVVTVNADPRFAFIDGEAMKAAPAEVTTGLRTAIDMVIAELARQIQAKY